MEVFFYILISTFLISLISFVGAVIFFLREEFLNKILLILVSFASGSMLGSAFLHSIPEAIEEVGSERTSLFKIFLFVILGFCAFFIFENFIKWHHHHVKSHQELGQDPRPDARFKHFSYLILISDGIHNFMDGLIVAGSFVVSIPLGMVTSLAVALHEIPQEMGDFGVLIHSGFKKAQALLLNFLSAIFAILGGITGFLLAERIGEAIIFILPLAAGSFIYISCSDLIPEIKHKASLQESLTNFLVFLSGIAMMFLTKLFFG